MNVYDRFTDRARQDPERMLELGAELARAHATNLGVRGVLPKSVELCACPVCGGRVLAAGEVASCTGCPWVGSVADSCR